MLQLREIEDIEHFCSQIFGVFDVSKSSVKWYPLTKDRAIWWNESRVLVLDSQLSVMEAKQWAVHLLLGNSRGPKEGKHPESFWKELDRLCCQWTGEGLCEQQQKVMDDELLCEIEPLENGMYCMCGAKVKECGHQFIQLNDTNVKCELCKVFLGGEGLKALGECDECSIDPALELGVASDPGATATTAKR